MADKPQITNWIENVPVRGLAGEIIGRAKVSNKGEIQASIDFGACAKETYDMLALPGMYDGLSISPYAVPAVPASPSQSESDRLLDKIRARRRAAGLPQGEPKQPFNQEGAH